jgi:hypothetical protein
MDNAERITSFVIISPGFQTLKKSMQRYVQGKQCGAETLPDPKRDTVRARMRHSSRARIRHCQGPEGCQGKTETLQ